jgi:general secretion pathway protein L
VSETLLVFLDAHGEQEGWLHVRDATVAARGPGLEDMPPLANGRGGDPIRVAAIVPGDALTLHWLELPAGLTPLQASAAARVVASEVSAQPLADMHVAVGPEADGSALRPVALVPALAMAGWLGRLQAQGLDPDLVIPEPLLLAPPVEGFVRYDRGETPLFRGQADAFSVEPELAELVVGGAPLETIGDGAFEAGIPAALEAPAVNLRQGAFAKRRQWAIDWKTVRRLVLLGVAILGVTLAIQIAAIWRYTYAADALEVETQAVAAQANAPAGLERRLTELRGGGVGYGAIAAAAFGAVRVTPNAELTGIAYSPDGSLRLTVQADSPATIAALRDRIEAGGFAAETGPMRTGGGRPTADLNVRPE